jgi:hypothetical protein
MNLHARFFMQAESPMASLAARLTDPQDRESYAALLRYFDSLPANDEMFRLAQLLGFLALIGQRIPEAAAGLLAELQAQAEAARSCYGLFDERCRAMKEEIAAGIDTARIAKAMAESVRQAAGSELGDVRVLAVEVEASLLVLSRTLRLTAAEAAAERAKLLQTTLDLQAATGASLEENERLRIVSSAFAFSTGVLAAFLAIVLVVLWP